MKTIIAGSRSIDDYQFIEWGMEKAIKDGWEITSVISGKAKGVDTLGERWAKGRLLEVLPFPARWRKPGQTLFDPGQGKLRNVRMAMEADALILFWDGVSPGSKSMMNCAAILKLPAKIYVRFGQNDYSQLYTGQTDDFPS